MPTKPLLSEMEKIEEQTLLLSLEAMNNSYNLHEVNFFFESVSHVCQGEG